MIQSNTRSTQSGWAWTEGRDQGYVRGPLGDASVVIARVGQLHPPTSRVPRDAAGPRHHDRPPLQLCCGVLPPPPPLLLLLFLLLFLLALAADRTRARHACMRACVAGAGDDEDDARGRRQP
eukprot:scaffold3720_cov401-Prasinococcus_capsulatus_cf.AAC.7